MPRGFKVEIGFVEESTSDSGVLTIGGNVIIGEPYEGAEGQVDFGTTVAKLRIEEIAFLKGARPDAIMFSVKKPTEVPEFSRWSGFHFVSD